MTCQSNSTRRELPGIFHGFGSETRYFTLGNCPCIELFPQHELQASFLVNMRFRRGIAFASPRDKARMKCQFAQLFRRECGIVRQSLRLLANLVEVRLGRKHFVPEPVQVFRHRIGIGPDRQFVSTLISVRRFGKQLRVNQRYSMQWLMPRGWT